MENIYKIKIRSNPDPRGLYPSERRYSSSIVLGLSLMFLVLSLTSSLMGTLVIRKLSIKNETIILINNNETNEQRFIQNIEKDLILDGTLPSENCSHTLNMSALISAGTFIMSFGTLLASITGIFAWKQWYIDNNITWFFLSSCFSLMTSSISLLIILIFFMEVSTDVDINVDDNDGSNYRNHPTIISFGLAANILITSLLAVIWSILATKTAFRGMKSTYPDDMGFSKGNNRQVCTKRKGNKIAKVVPPDILNDFPKTGKLAKYYPKKENNNLPKAESNKEYEERVKNFLAGQ